MSRITQSRRTRRRLIAVGCALLALAAAVLNTAGHATVAGVTETAMVDVPANGVAGTNLGDLAPITTESVLLGNLMTSRPVLADIARQLKVAPSQVTGATTYMYNIPDDMIGPDLGLRANQIIASRAPYQVDVQPDPQLPRVEIYARGPTLPQASALASAVVPALNQFLRADAAGHKLVPPLEVLHVKQLGPPIGQTLNSHAKYEIFGLTFLVALVSCVGIMLLFVRARRGWQLAASVATGKSGPVRTAADGAPHSSPVAHVAQKPTGPSVLDSRPSVTTLRGTASMRHHASRAGPRAPSRRGDFRGRQVWLTPAAMLERARTAGRPVINGSMTIADSGLALPARGTPPTVRAEKLRPGATRQGLRAIKDDWPRTHRILPWMLAMFIAVLWVVPFDAIQLNSSLPVNLKLDRLLLPVLVVVWGLAFVLSPRGKPRMKLTWIHGALFGFTGLAFLSSTLNAEGLNQLLQLDQGVKQLTLLAAYMTFFVIIASVVRPSEISAFLTYTLLLSVVAALGTLLEYRFHYNVFYTLSHQLFSGFQVAQPQTNMMDAEGRRLVEGPAGVSLEAVGMFTMALPIALARLTGATNSRRRVLYIAATSLLLAAMVSTERKSGLLGPLAVIIVFALVKRRQMLKLLPLAVVILAVIKVAAPAALGTVGNQIKPSAFGASTVDERVVRYDAIRPDLWLHPAMGSGYGTYIVRVMDNELLDRLLEGGVIGLVSYVTMIVMVGGVGFGVIRRRTPEAVMIGLIGASAAAATLILSSTYDLMAFPHNPYIFVSLAGLLAVAVKANDAAFNPPPRGSPTREPAWSR